MSVRLTKPWITTQDMTEEQRAEAILRRAIRNLPKHIELFYVSYDDKLDDKQITTLFASENGENEVIEDIEQRLEEGKWYSINHITKEVLENEDEPDLLDDYPDKAEQLRWAIEERDESTPLRDLMRHSRVLMRYRLGDDDNDILYPSYTMTKTERYQSARHLGKLAGLNWADYKGKLYELVDNASYGGVAYVIFYASVDELYTAQDALLRLGKTAGGTITWTDPYLLVLDRWNGSGHDVKINGKVTVPFDFTRLVSDAGDAGYSWDDVCGLVKSAYECDFTVTPPSPHRVAA